MISVGKTVSKRQTVCFIHLLIVPVCQVISCQCHPLSEHIAQFHVKPVNPELKMAKFKFLNRELIALDVCSLPCYQFKKALVGIVNCPERTMETVAPALEREVGRGR